MIAPEGWPFFTVPVFLGVVAVVLGLPIPGWVLVAIGAFALFFFRDPPRQCDAAPGIACSPADGKVIVVGPSPPPLQERGLPSQISVFMSVFNVHVNRAPIGGELLEYSYAPGRKFAAYKDKASDDNEQNLSVWRGEMGTVALKQIAGLIARRIVFDHRPGDRVDRAQRIGLIRYGSRVDVFLPPGTQILVGVGDRVRAGVTPIARLAPGGEA